jgi:hypothetical protein
MKKSSFLAGAALVLAGAGPAHADADGVPVNPLRDAYYGDLHLHTTYSFDAYLLLGTRVTPNQAYKFARGDAIPFLDHQVQRGEPLDFLAVTDHSENIGVFKDLDDPNSALSKSELGQKIGSRRGFSVFKDVAAYMIGPEHKQIPGFDPKPVAASAWQKEIDAANANYQPGKFTTLIAYEWTAMPQGLYNLHRNVFFRGDTAPAPYTSQDSNKPEDLWTYLESNRKNGSEGLAIPHNSNASGGLMYDWKDSYGRPIDQAYAERRALNEPLSEIGQNKGVSETHPALSPNDEFANFEIFDRLLLGTQKSSIYGSYVRDAYGRGLILQQTLGVNPFKFGVVGASDFHSGLSTSSESAFGGGLGGIDPTKDYPNAEAARKALTRRAANAPPDDNSGGLETIDFGSGNLTGVWAEANTRTGIYDALRRKETFATSGPKLKFRFFASWDYNAGLLKDADWVKTAYAKGVPMGGDLPARPAGAKAPRFAIWAVKDPNAANLDRAQVVKVWLVGGQYQEKVFDVALSGGRKVDPKTGKAPEVGNTVDLKTATYANSIGATELRTVWQDPEFDPARPAVYYLRVLEIPTPRWSTIMAARTGVPLPADKQATIQERGWSSPIWYTPPKS